MFARQLLLDFRGQTSSARRLRGSEPIAAWEVRNSAITSYGALPTFKGSIVDQLRAALEWGQEQIGAEGAALGFFGYEFARYLEPRALPYLQSDDLGLPEARLVFCRRLIQEVPSTPTHTSVPPSLLSLNEGSDFYQNGVGAIREYIAAGDIYQANLTHRFCAPPARLACPALRTIACLSSHALCGFAGMGRLRHRFKFPRTLSSDQGWHRAECPN